MSAPACTIAVIVPVHNAARYLPDCLESIAAQQFDDFCCILVDDGSQDESPVLCDNMAASMMKSGKINIVFVGCDRVARNGDAANKIGTMGVAILAKHFGIPFYVCAPSSTIDMSLASGEEIPIEQRSPEEVTEMWYQERMAPEGVKVYNPAFDVTDHSLITGIITERGLCHAPYDKAFEALGIGKE